MKPITPHDILMFNGKKWFHGERELTKGEIDNLKSEAEMMTKSILWKLVINQGKYYAQVRAITEAKTVADLRGVQEYHRAIRSFETFVSDILKK